MLRLALPLLAVAVAVSPATAGAVVSLSGSNTALAQTYDGDRISFGEAYPVLPMAAPVTVNASGANGPISLSATATLFAALLNGEVTMTGNYSASYTYSGAGSRPLFPAAEDFVYGPSVFRLTEAARFTLTNIPAQPLDPAAGWTQSLYVLRDLTNSEILLQTPVIYTPLTVALDLRPGDYEFYHFNHTWVNTSTSTGTPVVRTISHQFRVTITGITSTATPEPTSLLAFGSVLAVGGLSARRWRR